MSSAVNRIRQHPARLQTWIKGFLLASVMVATVAGPARAHAQSQQREIDADALLARELQRLVLIDIRLLPQPTSSDFRAAGVILDMAGRWASDDLELLRRRIEVAQAADDANAVDTLTDQLLRLDPNDTVSQLRAIASRLRRLQTVDDRLKAYGRLMNSGAIDPAVRSRLALDSALLRREQGDERGFAEELTLALQLDATNKEATLLAWTRYADRLTDAGRVELLANLLYADPLDPAVHRLMAIEMLKAGSFQRASRFLSSAIDLSKDPVSGMAPEWMLNEELVLSLYTQGPEVILQQVNQVIGQMQAQAAGAIQQAEAQGLPTANLVRPEDVRLVPSYTRERIVAAWMLGDDRSRAIAAAELRRDIEKWSEELQDPRNRPPGVDPQVIARQVALEAAEVWAYAAWLDTAPQMIEAQQIVLADRLGRDHIAYKRMEAYRQLRLGNALAAVEMLRELLPAGYIIDETAMAFALERSGQVDEAIRMYTSIVDRYPLRAVGAWSRQRLIGLDRPDVFASRERNRVEQIADAVPTWIDRMVRNPSMYLRFRASVVDPGPLETLSPGLVRIRLENIASIPLGIGAGRTIGGTVLLMPKLMVGTNEEFVMAQPEIVSLQRRLRLMPGEVIEVVVPADSGLMGWTANAGAARSVRADWRALLGFSVSYQDGLARRSTTGLESGTNTVLWLPLPEASLELDELTSRIELASPSDLPRLFAAVRAILIEHARHASRDLTTPQVERLAAVLAQRLNELPKRERLLMLAMLPSARIVPGMEALDRSALASTDEEVAALAIFTRAASMDHQAVTHWANSEKTTPARTLARALLESSILGRQSGLARIGPKVETMAPPRGMLLAP